MAIKTTARSIYEREDAMPMYTRDFVTETADRMIDDNHFSAEEVSIIRSAQYKSTTVREFQKNLEEMLYGTKKDV